MFKTFIIAPDRPFHSLKKQGFYISFTYTCPLVLTHLNEIDCLETFFDLIRVLVQAIAQNSLELDDWGRLNLSQLRNRLL